MIETKRSNRREGLIFRLFSAITLYTCHYAINILLSSFCISLSCLLWEKGSRDVASTQSKILLCTPKSQNLFNFASSRAKFLVIFVMRDFSISFTANQEKTYSFSMKRYLEPPTTLSFHAYLNSIIKSK